MFRKKRNSMAAEAPVAIDDESPADIAALEAELEAVEAAHENGEISDEHRDRKVIMNEIHEAELAARTAAKLGTDAKGNVTRKEFAELKVAVAVAIIGIEAARRNQNVSPRAVFNLLTANFAAMGFSRAQVKAIADFQHMADVVEKHYGDWDRSTKSQREYALQEASIRRPRMM